MLVGLMMLVRRPAHLHLVRCCKWPAIIHLAWQNGESRRANDDPYELNMVLTCLLGFFAVSLTNLLLGIDQTNDSLSNYKATKQTTNE